ncbi:hypothetical protein JYU11_01340 [bacterium AH-315-G05]|nr:hypothetical protein [bacterium AH-315-G05]
MTEQQAEILQFLSSFIKIKRQELQLMGDSWGWSKIVNNIKQGTETLNFLQRGIKLFIEIVNECELLRGRLFLLMQRLENAEK